MLLFPEHFPPFAFGASAGIAGIFAIFCRLQADSEIRWNFVLPIRADVLLWITAAISFFSQSSHPAAADTLLMGRISAESLPACFG